MRSIKSRTTHAGVEEALILVFPGDSDGFVQERRSELETSERHPAELRERGQVGASVLDDVAEDLGGEEESACRAHVELIW